MREAIRPTKSPLAEIRGLMPHRPLTAAESFNVIERQAARLLLRTDITGPSVPVLTVAQLLPRVEVQTTPDLGSSGRTDWSGSKWIIQISGDEAPVRQRFTLAHELGHIVLHPNADTSLVPYGDVTAAQRLERACDHFAACLLMPKTWVKRAYCADGLQSVPDIARLFNVSYEAARIRLEQLGHTSQTVRPLLRSAA